MRPARWLAALAPLLLGCAAQLGGNAGASLTTASTPMPVHAVWAGNVGISTVLGREQGVYLGAELESRNESAVGSRFTLGAELGYGWLPKPTQGAMGFEVHLDGGTPLAQGTLFPDRSFYVGGTAAVVWWLAARHDLSDVNTGEWLIAPVPELITYARGRVHFDFIDEVAARQDFVLGFAIRLRLKSDLF